MEEAGTCSRSAVWRRRVRTPPPLRVRSPEHWLQVRAFTSKLTIPGEAIPYPCTDPTASVRPAGAPRKTGPASRALAVPAGGAPRSPVIPATNACGRRQATRSIRAVRWRPAILTNRARIRRRTLAQRKRENLYSPPLAAQQQEVSLPQSL